MLDLFPMTPTSTWTKWITDPGHIRVVALDGSVLARELCDQQRLAPGARPGLAEAMVGALLIASSHKSNESINLNAKGSGIYRQAIIDATPEGRVRGFLIVNDEAAIGENRHWGTGILSILYTKNFEGKTPYTGMVSITDGHLGSAINDYYRDSEQLTSRVGLDVTEGPELVARGVLVQALGGATPAELELITNLTADQLRELAALSGRPAEFTARASALLGGVKLQQTETIPLERFCTCSSERIERALKLTGEVDTLDALGSDPHLEITCDFCRHEYKITAERIKSLFSPDPSRLQ